MKNEKDISRNVQKRIFQEANSRCSFCDESEVATLQIHHIKARTEGGGNEIENLILVCANCHTKITSGIITEADILRKKIMLLKGKTEARSSSASQNSIILENSSNAGVIANTITIKNPKKSSIKMQPPQGTIAADRVKRNYIKYLIDTYHDYKKKDQNVEKMNYAIFYETIRKRFKCKWDFVSEEKFEELAYYIQCRIDGTIFGKLKRKRGSRNYSSLEEYLTEI
ncbi:MAG: HNH endonuclease signature motif containing protein [Candidatus Aminicenantes bacterium]|nr:HNH endonuclease signature motif containing protein [Candidatus Aminicenantes bacterium]